MDEQGPKQVENQSNVADHGVLGSAFHRGIEPLNILVSTCFIEVAVVLAVSPALLDAHNGMNVIDFTIF